MEIGERLFGSKWFMGQVEKEVARDKLRPSDMIGEAIGVVAGIIVLAFFGIHQTRPTGFFTDEFGNLDAAVLYALIVLGMISPYIRFIFRRRNVARLYDAVGLGAFFIGGLYFLVTWPFDFAYFADPLPKVLEPILDWVSSTFARWIIGLGVVASPFFSVYTFALYIGVKKRLKGPSVPSQAEPPKA